MILSRRDKRRGKDRHEKEEENRDPRRPRPAKKKAGQWEQKEQEDRWSSLSKVRLRVNTERVVLVDAQQVCLHVVTSTEDALANRTPGLAGVQVLVQCQRHGVLETLPTNSTAKQEAGVRRSAGLTVIVVRDELGAAGRNGIVVATRDGGVSRGLLYKETTNTQTVTTLGRPLRHVDVWLGSWLLG